MALNFTDSSVGIGLYRETVTGILSAVAIAAGITGGSATGTGIFSAAGASAGAGAASGISSGSVSTGAGSCSSVGAASGRSQNNFTRLNIGIWPDFGLTSQLTRSWSVATFIQAGVSIEAFGEVQIQIDLEARPSLTSNATKALNAVSGVAAGTSTALAYSGSKASAAGTVSVLGVGALAGGVIGTAPGISAGTANVLGAGGARYASSATAAGSATAVAVGFQQGCIGTSAGSSTAAAVTNTTLSSSVGLSIGLCSAHADGTDIGPTYTETVPYLIGATQIPALAAIASIRCIANVIGIGGSVISQDPDAFTIVPRGTVITITLGGPLNNAPGRGRNGAAEYNSSVQ